MDSEGSGVVHPSLGKVALGNVGSAGEDVEVRPLALVELNEGHVFEAGVVGAQVCEELAEAQADPADGLFDGIALARARSEGHQPLRATGQGDSSRMTKFITRAVRTIPSVAQGGDYEELIRRLVKVEDRTCATERQRALAGLL